MLTQDVGSDVEGRHAIPITRLARNQLEVVVFLERLGEPFDARPRIGSRLTFNLSDFPPFGRADGGIPPAPIATWSVPT